MCKYPVGLGANRNRTVIVGKPFYGDEIPRRPSWLTTLAMLTTNVSQQESSRLFTLGLIIIFGRRSPDV
jgi:hypothetical protein